ncbi:MAG TPA: thiamine phosphate synthase [Lactobacillus sp.]|nr:thiamine phosphate synthase [Lactobacillus sp.]
MRFTKAQLAAYFVAGTQDMVDHRNLPDVLEKAIKGGITAFQYREKGPNALQGDAKRQMGEQLRNICSQAGIPFFVDDDVLLAQQLHADGVHVGQSDEAIARVIETVPDMIIGYSCHTLKQVTLANELAAIDYIGSGPIFPTISKDDADPAVGVAGLTQLVVQAKVPIVAIGGITLANLEKVKETGVAGAAVISLLTRASDIEKTAQTLKRTFSD